jgi:uncharacterized NAD-dependent epimerase/dehydratase family protein
MAYKQKPAIVLCEGAFGTNLGKTANGLVFYSNKYKIVGVVDSVHAGKDAGEVLDGRKRNIPVYKNIEDAISNSSVKPKFMIIGVASIGGKLPTTFRPFVEDALRYRLNIVSGLHEYLGDDKKFKALAKKYNVKILDIRKQPPLHKLHQFRNLCKDLDVIRLVVLGTDSSIGKRTTAISIAERLNEYNIKTIFIATGQTGLLQGAKYGVPLDAIQGDYMVGELEHTIVNAYRIEKPKIIVVEGQGSISHPAYVCGSRAILTATQPHGIILQHSPMRKYRNFGKQDLKLPMPEISREIKMLELFSNSKVIAITINHEGMNLLQIEEVINEYESRYKVPVSDILVHGPDKIVEHIKKLYISKSI